MIDFNNITNTIKEYFEDIIFGDSYYNGYFITISNEQDYNYTISEAQKYMNEENHIYIIVKFRPATLFLGQKFLPITINAMSEENQLEACQKLLYTFSDKYNGEMAEGEKESIMQFYDSPQVISNFEEINSGYRSLMSISGTLLISEDSNPKKYYFYDIKLNEGTNANNVIINEKKFLEKIEELGSEISVLHTIYKDRYGIWHYFYYTLEGNSSNPILITSPSEFGITYDETILPGGIELTIKIDVKREEIQALMTQSTCDIQFDTQPFFNSQNFVRSVSSFGMYILNFSMYLVDNSFLNRVIAITLGDTNTVKKGINDTFPIDIEYKNGIKSRKYFKLASYSDKGEIKAFPVVNVSLSI